MPYLPRARSFTLSLAGGLCLVLAACGGGSGSMSGPGAAAVGLQPQPGTETDTAWQGERSQASERLELVARTDGDWQQLWNRAGVAAPFALPSDRMAVAIFLGRRTGPGYAVTLEAARVAAGGVSIPYRESVPGPDDATPSQQQPASPFAIRLIAFSAQPVTFSLAP